MTSYKLLVGDMFDMIDEVDPFSVNRLMAAANQGSLFGFGGSTE